MCPSVCLCKKRVHSCMCVHSVSLISAQPQLTIQEKCSVAQGPFWSEVLWENRALVAFKDLLCYCRWIFSLPCCRDRPGGSNSALEADLPFLSTLSRRLKGTLDWKIHLHDIKYSSSRLQKTICERQQLVAWFHSSWFESNWSCSCVYWIRWQDDQADNYPRLQIWVICGLISNDNITVTVWSLQSGWTNLANVAVDNISSTDSSLYSLCSSCISNH